MNRHAIEVDALCTAVLATPGDSHVTARRAAFEGLSGYARKVHEAAYRLTDRDIDELRAAGHSEDEIFELTLAATLGAASRRLQAGLSAMDG